MGGMMNGLSMAVELKSVTAYREMLRHLRSGGLKHDRKGSEGEDLDALPPSPGLDFSVAIDGERDYRLTLGQRSETEHDRRYAWVYAKLEFIGRKRGKSWVIVERSMNADRLWRARTDSEATLHTMKHPFGVFIFSCDYLSISTSSLGSMPYHERVPDLLAAMAKLFERGKL